VPQVSRGLELDASARYYLFRHLFGFIAVPSGMTSPLSLPTHSFYCLIAGPLENVTSSVSAVQVASEVASQGTSEKNRPYLLHIVPAFPAINVPQVSRGLELDASARYYLFRHLFGFIAVPTHAFDWAIVEHAMMLLLFERTDQIRRCDITRCVRKEQS
jgi:hypothetical protein